MSTAIEEYMKAHYFFVENVITDVPAMEAQLEELYQKLTDEEKEEAWRIICNNFEADELLTQPRS